MSYLRFFKLASDFANIYYTYLPFSSRRSEVETNYRSQSGDCDKRDVSSSDRRGDVCSTWEGDEPPKDACGFFAFWWCECDEGGVWEECAEDGDDCEVEHPHKSNKATSSPSEHTAILIRFTDQHFLKVVVHSADLHIPNKLSAFFRSFSF